MTEKQKTYSVELLTPCFCKIGDGKPEIRGSSIRGMIREWKRLLGGNPDNLWGGAGGNASKIGIDLKNVVTTKSSHQLLPHKGGTSPKAVDEGGTFTLVLNRLVGCSEPMWNEAKQDVKNWLVLGCLGQRSNRAAGSVWCDAFGIDSQVQLKSSFGHTPGYIYISSTFTNPLIARETASDTVDGNPRHFGSFNPRKSSPIKMKIIKFDEDDYRILFFAKNRRLIQEGFQLLQEKPDNHRWRDVLITLLA